MVAIRHQFFCVNQSRTQSNACSRVRVGGNGIDLRKISYAAPKLLISRQPMKLRISFRFPRANANPNPRTGIALGTRLCVNQCSMGWGRGAGGRGAGGGAIGISNYVIYYSTVFGKDSRSLITTEQCDNKF